MLERFLTALEVDEVYRQNAFGRLASTCILAYCWTVCGDSMRAHHYANRMLDVLEQNLFLVVFPIMNYMEQLPLLYSKIDGAFDLENRLRQILASTSEFGFDVAICQHENIAPILIQLIDSVQISSAKALITDTYAEFSELDDLLAIWGSEAMEEFADQCF